MGLKETIQIGAQDALALVEIVLPMVETAFPQVAAADAAIRLGDSVARKLAPIVGRIVEDLSNKGLIGSDVQADYAARFAKVLDFSGQEWKPSTAGGIPAPAPAPVPPPAPSSPS